MIDVPIEPWWRRSVNFTPAAATLGGIAIGAALGCVLAFQCFDRVSRDLSLFLTFMGGAWGYIFWLTSDHARAERFQRIVALVAVVATAVLVLAFPNISWQLIRAGGGIIPCIVLGGICAVSMFIVAAGWGFVHLVGHLSCLLVGDRKSSMTSSFEGVWDREMDQNLPAGKCDA
jgi:hypothetical protein